MIYFNVHQQEVSQLNPSINLGPVNDLILIPVKDNIKYLHLKPSLFFCLFRVSLVKFWFQSVVHILVLYILV